MRRTATEAWFVQYREFHYGLCGLQLPHKGSEEAGANLFSIVMVIGPKETSMELCHGRIRLGVKKRFISKRGLGTGTRSPGQLSQHQDVFRQYSQMYGLNFEWFLMGARSWTQ